MSVFKIVFIFIFIFPFISYSEMNIYENESFIFRYNDSVKGSVEKLIRNSEKIKKKVENFIGKKISYKIIVDVAEDLKSFSLMLGRDGIVEEWIVGVAFPKEKRMVLSATGNEIFYLEDTFTHELTHIYLAEATEGRSLPRWFNEAISMFVADESLIERLKTAINASVFKNFIPIEELRNKFPSTKPLIHLAYAQSYIFLKYIIHKKGIESIHSIMKNLKNGHSFENAFYLATSMSVEDMFREWLEKFEEKKTWIAFITDSSIIWLLITIFFLTGYAIKKIKTKKKLQMWEIKEEL